MDAGRPRPLEQAAPRAYNPNVYTIVEEMKSYIGFGQQDADNLRALAEFVTPRLEEVVDRFYKTILDQPGASGVFPGGEVQAAQLKGFFARWLETLFCGEYDAQYIKRRLNIGHTHVRVAMPQHYMFAAMEIVWQDLERIAIEADVPDVAAKLRSLHKLLAIETAIMLESYKSSYSDRIRELERSSIEERLSRAEHLAEIGQLAASLAHEIKNPLAGIGGAIQVIRKELARDDRNWPILDEILREVWRVDGTLKDLLAYARPQSTQVERCDLNTVIQRSVKLLRGEKSFAAVNFECADCRGLPAVEVDENQIEQLLVNLLLNAAQASKPGDPVRLRVAKDADSIMLAIEDKGHGIDQETLARVFEPFFTTKARGTGLGLAIARRIMDGHNGSVSIRSEIGKGTVVEVRLPIRRAAQDQATG